MSQWDTTTRQMILKICVAAVLCCMAAKADGKVLVTLDEALKLAFPACSVKKESFYLTPEQRTSAAKIAEGEVESSLLIRYQADCKGSQSGYAYVDTHRVRTQEEAIFIVLNMDKSLRTVEVLSFNEPTEYIPKSKWYELFKGHLLNDDLQIKKGISPVTGASLTARATTQAVRRVLALDQVISSPSPASKSSKP